MTNTGEIVGRSGGKSFAKKQVEVKTPIAKDMFIPNFSGDHSAGRVLRTPTNDTDIANKKYVDDNAGGTPEGTAIKSTGETGASKFLREDGDNSCSWQEIPDNFIKNNADDTSTGKITAANFAVTGDNNTNDSEYVPMVLHGTDATPPTASNFPRGSIYIQYTA